MTMLQLPFFAELAKARNILIAGVDGGFNIFCGLPLYFGLKAAGGSGSVYQVYKM